METLGLSTTKRIASVALVLFSSVFAGAQPPAARPIPSSTGTPEIPQVIVMSAGMGGPAEDNVAPQPPKINPSAPVAGVPVVTRNADPSGITYTCDPAINALSGVCETLNTTISGIYGRIFSNASASIYIKFGNTGLGASQTFLSSVSYAGYRSVLERSVTNANDVTAFTSSVPLVNPLDSSFRVALTNSILRALGFTIIGGFQANGTRCTPGVTDCYDGIITISSAFQAAGHLYYRTGSILSNQADFYTVVEHETDEILGTLSCLPTACGGGFIAPPDLFRYHSDGTRSFAPGTNDSCSSASATNACFSLDGIQMLQQYNNVNDGRDLGDWLTDCSRPLVQGANACAGSANIDISPAAEVKVLDAIGFRLNTEDPPPPTVLTKVTSDANGGMITTCTTPPLVTNFTSSSLRAWFYFTVAGVKAGDSTQIQFLRPDGVVYSTTSFSMFPVGNTGVQCFPAFMAIEGATAASFPGIWKVQAFWDQSAAPLVALNFSISATPTCTYSLDSGGQAFNSLGGTGSVNLKATPGCFWTVSDAPDWVTVLDADGDNRQSVSYQVLPNPGAARSGRLNIAGLSFTVEQQAALIPGLSVIGSMPHLAAQEGWATTFTLVNHGVGSTQARFTMFGDSGASLPLPLVFPQKPAAAGPLLAASIDRTIAANASLLIGTAGAIGAPLQVGSVQLSATDAVGGYALFSYLPTQQEAVVPLENRNASSYLLPFDNTKGIVLGVAISNLSNQAANIPVLIRDETGAQIATNTVPLPGSGHTAFVLSSQFPITANIRGTLEVTPPSSIQVSALAIRFTPSGTMTSIPLLAGLDSSGGSFPHIASAGGWKSTFVLVNTGATTAQVNLRFLDDNGVPLTLPLTFPASSDEASTASTIDRTLTAGATLIIESTGQDTDSLLTGSAQLVTNGKVGGFVMLRYLPNGQETAVALENRRARAYILPFDHTGGTVTGVALNNASTQPAAETVVIRDDTGALIGIGSVSLVANGHTAFLLADKFPVTAHIRGTLEFDALSGATVSVVGIRTPPALTFATLPTIAK